MHSSEAQNLPARRLWPRLVQPLRRDQTEADRTQARNGFEGRSKIRINKIIANTTARFSYPSMTRALQFEDEESDVVQGLFFYIKSKDDASTPKRYRTYHSRESSHGPRICSLLDSRSSKNETFRIGKKFLKESLVEGHFKSRLSRWSRWMQCLGGCQSFPRALEETRVDGFFSLHLSSQRPPAALYRSF